MAGVAPAPARGAAEAAVPGGIAAGAAGGGRAGPVVGDGAFAGAGDAPGLQVAGRVPPALPQGGIGAPALPVPLPV